MQRFRTCNTPMILLQLVATPQGKCPCLHYVCEQDKTQIGEVVGLIQVVHDSVMSCWPACSLLSIEHGKHSCWQTRNRAEQLPLMQPDSLLLLQSSFLHATPHLRDLLESLHLLQDTHYVKMCQRKMAHPLCEFCLHGYSLLPNLVQKFVTWTISFFHIPGHTKRA